MPNLPTTLAQIRALAEKTFADFPLTYKIEIETTWGNVWVDRDLNITQE